jgi:ferric-dicitrate binding protein FerR (iron transport regulator)
MQQIPNTKSWISGEFSFDHAPLTEVVKQLNTYYPKEIVLGSEAAQTKELTAKFSNQSLEEVIEIIVLTCDLQSEFTESRVVLK